MHIKILTLNIEGEKHLKAVQALVKKEKPDVICFQEIFEKDFHQFRDNLKISGLFQPTIDVNASGRPGYHERGLMGVAMLGSLNGEFQGSYYFKRRSKSVPLYSGLPNAGHRVLVWQTIKTPKGNLTVATTHFTWSKEGKTTEKQRKELRSLFKLLDKGKPDILCGDFNAPRGGAIFDALSKRLTDNIPQDITSTIDPLLHYSHKKIDFVVDGFFTTPKCKVTRIQLIDGVSDHKAIIVTVCVSC